MIDAGDRRLPKLCLGVLSPEEAEQLHRDGYASALGLGLVDLFRTLPDLESMRLQRAAQIEDRARYWEAAGNDAWPPLAGVTERAQAAAERCWYRAGALRRAARIVAEGRIPPEWSEGVGT